MDASEKDWFGCVLMAGANFDEWLDFPAPFTLQQVKGDA